MNMMRILRFSILAVFIGSLVLAGALAQPSMGGVKRKAGELKEAGEEPAKKVAKPAEPVVFAYGPDEVANFEINPTSRRNVIKFQSKAPKETIEGKATKIQGTLSFNPRKLDSIEGKFTVLWSDVDTGNKTRNQHMMAAPWVDAKSHPEITFTVTGIEDLSAKAKPVKIITAKLVGTMAMNGKEKEMKIPVTLTYLETIGAPKKDEAPREGLAIKAKKFKIALADFDIKGRGVGQSVAEEQEFSTVSMMMTGPEHKPENKQTQPKTPVKKPPPPRGA